MGAIETIKIKIELTPEEWGFVTAALSKVDVLKEFKDINKDIMNQLEKQFQERDKEFC